MKRPRKVRSVGSINFYHGYMVVQLCLCHFVSTLCAGDPLCRLLNIKSISMKFSTGTCQVDDVDHELMPRYRWIFGF